MPDMFETASCFRRRFVAGAVLFAAVLLDMATLGSGASAQQGYPPPGGAPQAAVNPVCPRLEAQLASIDRGGADPARAEQIRRYEDSVNRQQAELDRVTMQAKRMGCDSSGFFSLFNGQSAQCGPVNNQIQQMRGNLDQMTSGLERLRGGGPGGGERDNQRRSVLMALAQNNCGPQYAAAAQGGGGFLDNLFRGNPQGAPGALPDFNTDSGTFRTVCVRTCDGFYFPISFATVPARFADDEKTCKNLCPASEAALYAHRNPGQDMNQAVSINGQPYTSLPAAFRYRQEFNPACSCKAANQSWADALKGVDDTSAREHGDIIVTEESAKRMALPPAQRAAAQRKGTTAAPAPATGDAKPPATTGSSDPNTIRSVGPTFLPKMQ
ncbi:DUF2865 domain-containing protein [Rhodopseudomonas pseudopalustris]|uniref:DUF2865 domain-containing protein n=1 Tax=Rhodopseudomonas pseudopalustris TaxID=1513892 RepID=A0A1H8S8M9_9BRAD|nr:DUF2865 domain-containing protein [Rhodopseudomonas pseudopalustris]MBB1093185.1 DUF2865 domain-containing protein [Rhodopseudomonas palustris]SEO74897.1 Protein of unknown function [Rhodopseudomonas pseudopalustris]